MLDTNICIYVMKRMPPEVAAAMRMHEAAGIGVSTITLAELEHGVARSGSARNKHLLAEFLAPLEVADFDRAAAGRFGVVRAALFAAGTPIGPLDTLLAAHALALDATLVTHNTREFSRVPGLRLADWVQPN